MQLYQSQPCFPDNINVKIELTIDPVKTNHLHHKCLILAPKEPSLSKASSGKESSRANVNAGLAIVALHLSRMIALIKSQVQIKISMSRNV